MRRRDFITLLGSPAVAAQAPAVITSDALRPKASQGVQVGDVVLGRAIVWSRTDRPAQMIIEYATTESFRDLRRVVGPHALETTDFTARVDVTGLPSGQQVFCRVQFRSLRDGKTLSEPVTASFRTPSEAPRDVRFVWSGDTAGQGWGINPDWGGMRIYETMHRRQPDFFIHSGDTIYADQPISAEVKLPDGSLWRNVVTEAKSKVAETLEEFRGNYLYNLLDANVRRFNAEVPQVWQWDDHEVLNNWSPGKDLTRFPQYSEKSIHLLAARGSRAFLEYAPVRGSIENTERIYRKIPYGPLLDVFVIDMRSYRGPNTHNRQMQESAETVYLGKPQIEWLISGLAESRATWKVVASDMPISLMVGDGKDSEGRPIFENSANGNGPPLGRELEMAHLLRSIKTKAVRNVVWLTADTHYTAAHYFDPAKAQMTDFHPFWEFLSGPLNSGTFGPSATDNTFGIQVRYFKAPEKGTGNLPPSAGMQFFGEVEIEGKTRMMSVTLRDVAGNALFRQDIQPERGTNNG